MELEDKQLLEDILKSQIKTLTKDVAILQTQLKPVEKDCSLDNVYHEGRHQEQNIIFHRFEENTKHLNRLIATLDLITKEEYGICKECEEDIAFERLKIRPESVYCVACMNELGL